MNPDKKIDGNLLLSLLLGLLCIPFYLAGSSPLIFWRDSAEYSMIGHNLDIGHPAGSPTFSMVEKALDFLPLGSIAFRATLLTTVLAGLAVSLSSLLILRLAAERRIRWPMAEIAAFLPAASFAFSPAFYDWNVAPEVYSGQVFFLNLTLILCLKIHEIRHTGLTDRRYFFLAGFLLGLSCGMHMGMILLAPGLGLLLLWADRRLIRFRHFSVFALFFILGFSIYLFLPVRSAAEVPFDQGNTESFVAFIAHITGKTYSGILNSYPWPRIVYNLKALAGHCADQLTPAVAVCAIAGAVIVLLRRPFVFFCLILLAVGHFYLYIKDWHAAFGYIPLFSIASILAAVAVLALFETATKADNVWVIRIPVALVFLLVAGTLAFQVNRAVAGHSRSENDLLHRHARGILDSLPENSVYISYMDASSYSIFYMQSVERYREDIRHIQRAFLDYPDYLAKRYPEIDWTTYRANEPYGAQKFFLAHAGEWETFWDYGWEEKAQVAPEALEPYGFVYKVVPPSADPPRIRAEIFRRYFGPVRDAVGRFPADFTVREIYSGYFSVFAKMQFDRGDAAGAAASIREAIEIRPAFGQLYARRGVLRALGGDTQGAWTDAVYATEIEPYYLDNWNDRAAFAFRLGKADDAVASLKKSLALNRYQARPAVDLAGILLAQRNFAEAHDHSKDALKAAPNNETARDAREILVRSLIGLSRCADAVPELHRLIGEDPNNEQAKKLLTFCASSWSSGPSSGGKVD